LARATDLTAAENSAGRAGAATAATSSPAVPQAWDVECGPQQLSALRRKPGRGDATLSMSCSDKLARWACLGVQGALLTSLLARPLHVATLSVSAPRPCGAGCSRCRGCVETVVLREDQQDGAWVGSERTADAHFECCQCEALQTAVARAVAGRVAHVAQERLRPPFEWRPPAVAVVGPPPEQLGLSPSEARTVPSGAARGPEARCARAVGPRVPDAALPSAAPAAQTARRLTPPGAPLPPLETPAVPPLTLRTPCALQASPSTGLQLAYRPNMTCGSTGMALSGTSSPPRAPTKSPSRPRAARPAASGRAPPPPRAARASAAPSWQGGSPRCDRGSLPSAAAAPVLVRMGQAAAALLRPSGRGWRLPTRRRP
jgi:hypothetical protein